MKAHVRGKLTAVCGPMFSGKTTYLIRTFGDGTDAVVFKPDLDARYTKRPVVISHDKEEIPAVLVNHQHPQEMVDLVGTCRRVFIDEVNFFDESLMPYVEQFLAEGRDVYVSGLSEDAEGRVFGPMRLLVAQADERVDLAARCDGMSGTCPAPATRSYRKIPRAEQVSVAGADEYGAACARHYTELHHKA